MEKRILYIILGVMLLSVKGMGQSFTFDVSSGYNIYPAENCDQVIFSANNPSSSSISLEIYYSNDGIATYNRLPTGYSIPANSSDYTFPVFQTGFYFVKWKNGAVVIQTSSTKRIVINPLPNATVAASSTICNGYQVSLGSTEISGNTYSWSSNVGTYSSTESNPSVNPTVTQTYRLTETITSTGCYNSNDVTITVNNVSSGTISGTQALCVGGDPIEFTSLVDGGGSGVLTYKWEFKPNGQIGWTEDPTLLSSTYNPPSGLTRTTDYRRFTISTLNSVSCTSTPTNEINVTLNPLPTKPTLTSQIICEGQSTNVSMSAPTGVYTYTWQVPTGVATSTTNSVNTTKAGTYSLSITNANNCTSEVGSATVVVNTLPTKPTLTSQTICEGQSTNVSMSAPAGVYTYTWQVPTGVATSTTNIVNTTKAGTYSLSITNANNCTSEVGSATVVVNTLPTKPTLTSQAICEGTTATITGPSGTYTYTWQVPTGVATSTSNSVTTTKAGTYSLTITDANTCTSEVGTGIVTVNALPTKPTLTSQAICEGTTATITGPSGTYTYTWQVPNGVATSTTKSVSTNKAGTYTLTITDVNSCTSEAGTATVTVNQLPAKPTLTSQAICEGTTATITGPTGVYTYTWQVPTGVATSTTKSVSTNKAGTYSLTITDANTCTSEVGTATISVNALPPKPTLTSPVICEGATATVTMSTPAGTNTYTYNWQVPTGVATSTSNSVTTTKAGTYSLTITDANTCTSEVGTGIVTVNAIPTFTISSPSVCLGATLIISANPITGEKSDYNYTWQVPNGASIPGNVSNFTTTTSGVYTATIKNKITNCESASLNNNAIFYPLPIAKSIVASDNKVIENKTLNLTAAASGGTSPYIFTWTPNSTINYTISGQENAVFNAIKEGKVNIKYQVKDVNNCEAISGEYEITINKAAITGSAFPFAVPNAFSPNGDGKNDKFKIIFNNTTGVKLSLQIFNRNGTLMFNTNNISEGWDGRYKDVMQDMGIYFVKYRIEIAGGMTYEDTPRLYLFK